MNNKSEKKIDRILGYLTLSIVLLLLGLLFSDSLGFRGFPFGWYHHPDYIKFEWLLASFGVLLAVTICAAVISAVIGGLIEPDMKVLTVKAPETNPVKPVVKTDEKENVKKESKSKEIKTSELKTVIKQISKSDSEAKKDENISKAVIMFLAFAVFGFSFFATFDDEDYDPGYYDDTYDYEDDLTDDTEIMSEAASEAVNLFLNGDYDSLSEIGDTSSIEDFVFTNDSGFEEFGDPYMYSADDTEQMVFRYILYDDASDEYAGACLVGVLVEKSDDYYSSDEAKVSGMCVYNFRSYDDYQNYQEDPSRWITPAECFVLGLTDIDGTFIMNVFDD